MGEGVRDDDERLGAYPPMPTVKARSCQFRPSMIGISRPRKLPGPSRISCECPCSAAEKPSWVWFVMPPSWECRCAVAIAGESISEFSNYCIQSLE